MTLEMSIEGKYVYEKKYTLKLGKYKFRLRPEEKRTLAKRSEDEEFDKAMDNNADDELAASIEYAVRFQSNSVIQLIGIPESGKSAIARYIVFKLKSKLENEGKKTSIKLTYDYAQTIHHIAEFGKLHLLDGEFVKSDKILIIFQDEQSNLQGPESRSYETQLNTLLERFRAAQVFVILVSPNYREFSVCNTIIESIGKDYESSKNLAMWYVKKNSKLHPWGTLLIPFLPEVEVFFSSYNSAKMKDIAELMKRRGLQTITIPPEVIDEGVNRLLTEGKRRKVRTKEQLKSLGNILGLGTSNTTKTINEIAALQFEIENDLEKEILELELLQQKEIEDEEEKQRISNLVIKVAQELNNKFDFVNEKKAFTRLTKGFIIEKYPEDWQELLKHRSAMWALAEYWQNEYIIGEGNKKITPRLPRATSSRNLLRLALETSVLMRNFDAQLAQRTSFYFIWNKEYKNKKSWSIKKAVDQLNKDHNLILNSGSMRKYFGDNSKNGNIQNIEKNNKIWGDAGEIYLKSKIQKIWEKGQNEGWIGSEVTHDLLCAAELRSKLSESKKGDTSLYDVEIIINEKSVAAINCKFSYLEARGYKMFPEDQHDNPYLFLIDKNTLDEFLVPSKKGKPYEYITEEGTCVTVEEMLKDLISSM